MGSLIILLVSSLFLCLSFILVKFLYKVWWMPLHIQQLMKAQGIKGPSYKFIFGNTKEISKMREKSMEKPMDFSHYILPRIQPHIYAWAKIYGSNFVLWDGPKAELVVTDPVYVKEILHNRDEFYTKSDGSIYVKKIFGDGLVLTDGEKWTKMRRLADYAFHGESLKGMTQAMIQSVEMLLARWKHQTGKEVEVHNEFRMLASDVISRTAFGSNYLEGRRIFDMLPKMASIAAKNSYKIRIPGLSKIFRSEDDIESDKIDKEISESVVRIIQTREKAANEGEINSYGSDFLGLLLKANHDPNAINQLSLQDIIDECKTFYAAGSGTTAILLTWTTVLLAFYPDWQEKARKEVLELFGKENPTYEGLRKLKTMSMIINETLRLYPSVFRLVRRVKKDAKVGELNLPTNTTVSIPLLALHSDTKIWGEDAHLFKPERFSEGIVKATRNNPAAIFLSFGLGPRNCVGMNFASNEVKIALSMILQRYAIKPSPNYIHSPADLVLLRPQHSVQVMIQAL